MATSTLYFLFLAGLVLAEIDAIRGTGRAAQGAAWVAIIQGLAAPFLAPWEVSPVLLLSTSLMCWGLITAEPVRRFLSSGPSRKLGTISFPLYLVHGPAMFIVGLPLFVAANGNSAAIALVGVVVCIASFGAAVPFVFVDEIAMRCSRAIGRMVMPRRRALEA